VRSKSRTSFSKRQKERTRQDRRSRKLERRAQRQADRRQGTDTTDAAPPIDPTSADAPKPDLDAEIIISSVVSPQRPPPEDG